MIWNFFLFILLSSAIFTEAEEDEEARASYFHDEIFEPQFRNWFHRFSLANWEYQTNITEENEDKLNEVSLGMADFTKNTWKEFTSYKWRSFRNETLKRLFYLNSNLGIKALDDDKLAQVTEIVNNMVGIYNKVMVCDYYNRQNCTLHLKSEILPIMASSRNFEELLHIWEQWHSNCGRPIKEKYIHYVSLSNEAAQLNGFESLADMWIDDFESDTFEDDVELIWLQLKPFYEELHAFVRRRLISVYGEDKVRADGPIPAHILGDLWAQRWKALYDLLVPFPGKQTLDVTESLREQGYTVPNMFELSDSFYQSLGLLKLPESFWQLSILTKPTDRDIACHASAWQIQNNDVRIKMCAKQAMTDLFTIHHELGHIQYFLQYAQQPSTFQEAPNPGFHEAIGDSMVLSVSTPKHLKQIGLLTNFQDDEEFDLNHLMMMALEKVSALPFNYLVDRWRWSVFRGIITPRHYNSKWWEMSKYYQGIEPYRERSEYEFDAAAKIHIPSSDPYISYFVSSIFEFQLHEALCRAAGEFDPNDPRKPLHRCDIYGNEQAGALLGNMMRQGSSRHWKDILEELTGTKKLDPSSIINFFLPLFRYIRDENRRNNEYIGWRGIQRSKNNFKQFIGLPIKKTSKHRFIF